MDKCDGSTEQRVQQKLKSGRVRENRVSFRVKGKRETVGQELDSRTRWRK